MLKRSLVAVRLLSAECLPRMPHFRWTWQYPMTRWKAWARQGAVEASKRTHEAVRAALDAYSWPPEYSYTVYLQGSYRNYTNTRGNSDVDIVAELRSSFSLDLSILSQPDQAAFRAYYSDAQDDWSDFRQHVLTALIGWFGASAIREDAKAIRVLGDSNRLDADVLVCQERRIYTQFQSASFAAIRVRSALPGSHHEEMDRQLPEGTHR